MKVSELISQCSVQLLDTGNTRWTAAELLDYYNDGALQIVTVMPGASPTTAAVIMVAGTKQSLPTDATGLVNITRNMGTDGTTVGNAITLINKETLDQVAPDWHTETQVATITHYMYNKDLPLLFDIYPPNLGTGYVEMSYGKAPATVAVGNEATTDIPLTTDYLMAIKSYILWQAFVKDAAQETSRQRAEEHKTDFMGIMGLIDTTDNKTDPNRTNKMHRR
jgi:hypothetical protein